MARPTALQRLARRALLTKAKADSGLLALVPASSIDPDGEPTWPFILIESERGTPLKAACVRGANVSMDVHAFATGSASQTGRDAASAIGAAIEAVFADNVIDLEDGSKARITLSDMNLLKDGDPDSFHWFAQLNCRALAPTA
jgi:hypothetical protein